MSRFTLSFGNIASPATAFRRVFATAQQTHTAFVQSIYRRIHEVSSSLGSLFRTGFLSLEGYNAQEMSFSRPLFLRNTQMLTLFRRSAREEPLFVEPQRMAVSEEQFEKQMDELVEKLGRLCLEEPEEPKASRAPNAQKELDSSKSLETSKSIKSSSWQTVKKGLSKRKLEKPSLTNPTVIPGMLQNLKKLLKKQGKVKLGEPIFDTSKHKKVNIYDCLVEET